jgi:nicotinate dehydrogenase subunit B
MNVPVLPSGLAKHPRLGQWLDLAPDGRVRAYSGKVEIGQGILHALRLIVAEELQLDPSQIEMVRASTARSPDESVTSGSLSIQHSGAALRCAAAHMREACRGRWARQLGVAPEAVKIENGVFFVDGKDARAGYPQLVDSALLAGTIEPLHAGSNAHNRAGLGATPRSDIAQKVFAQFEYLQDAVLPHLCFGQVFRPTTLLAQVSEAAAARLVSELTRLDGVIEAFRDGILIGVLAQEENVLAKAAKKVSAANLWRGCADIPAGDAVGAWLKAQSLDTTVIADQKPQAATGAPHRTIRAEFDRPYLQHASIGLCCAIAQWSDGALQVFSHSQAIFNLRRDLALAFGIPEDSVAVSHWEAAGCYGHNGADDVAFDAAWLARRAAGRPVKIQWTRHSEMANSPLGPAMTVAVEAGLDERGRLVSWRHEVWSQGHGTRPGRGETPALLGAWQTAHATPVTMAVNQPPASGGGSDRNAVPPYTIPRIEVLNHRVLAMPVRVSALRSLGAHTNVFAAESMMDEVAVSLGRDPLEFRLAHLDDERARAVLIEAARMSNWSAAAPADAAEGFGRGLAFARYKNTSAYCAVVAHLIVEDKVKLRKLFIAADLGRVVHPDGARNQIEGGAVQSASWTLCEAADVGPEGIRSDDWESYPILRFSDVPQVEVALIDRPDCASLGAGECSAGPTAAAIANAIHNAIGVRIRAMPFTAEHLLKLVQSEPVAS